MIILLEVGATQVAGRISKIEHLKFCSYIMYTYNPHIHSSICLIPIFLELAKSFLNETSSTSPALAVTIGMTNSSHRKNLILSKHSHVMLLCIYWFTFRNTFSLFSNCYTENILFLNLKYPLICYCSLLYAMNIYWAWPCPSEQGPVSPPVSLSHEEASINLWTSFIRGLLLLSRFSHVRLCAAPRTAAHQAPLSLGFSRQEHWSGLSFPSPMLESESEVVQSCPALSDPMDCSLPGSSVHGIFQVRVLEWVAISFFIH